MGKSSPSAPDPTQLAAAQGTANAQAVLQSALVNQITQRTPYGTVSYTGDLPQVNPETGAFTTTRQVPRIDPATGRPALDAAGNPLFDTVPLDPRQQVITLSPAEQQKLDQQNAIASLLLGSGLGVAGNIAGQAPFSLSGMPAPAASLGVDAPVLDTARQATPQVRTAFGGPETAAVSALDFSRLSALPTAGDFMPAAQQQQAAAFQSGLGLLAPQWANAFRALDTNLAVKGLPVGGEAYNRAMEQFNSDRGNALNQLALQSVAAGNAQQASLFGQALSSRQQGTAEIAAQGEFANSAAQQDYAMALGRAQFYNDALAQSLRNGIAAQQAQNSALGSQYGIDANLATQNANLQNNARQQAISDLLLQRTQPINEIAALLQGAPALATPQFSAPAQLQVPPVDVIGPSLAYYNAQNQQTNTALSGLFGLGRSLFGAVL